MTQEKNTTANAYNTGNDYEFVISICELEGLLHEAKAQSLARHKRIKKSNTIVVRNLIHNNHDKDGKLLSFQKAKIDDKDFGSLVDYSGAIEHDKRGA